MYRRSALAKIQRTFMYVKTVRSAAFAAGAKKNVHVQQKRKTFANYHNAKHCVCASSDAIIEGLRSVKFAPCGSQAGAFIAEGWSPKRCLFNSCRDCRLIAVLFRQCNLQLGADLGQISRKHAKCNV